MTLTPAKFLSTACPQTLAAAMDPVEARALELHETRKTNYARNYPWAEPLTFDGGERDFCLASARNAIAEEEYQAAKQSHEDKWYADQLAAFTDEMIAFRIGKIDEEVELLPYRSLSVNIADRGAGLADERRRLVTEQECRAAVASALNVEAA